MKIAILSPKAPETAETFIKNHIKYLPFKKIVVFGGNFPYIINAVSYKWSFKILIGVNSIKKVLGVKHPPLKVTLLSRILKRNDVDLVFAEYLTTGAQVFEVCRNLGIPLIVTALGYDVFQHDVIDRNSANYKEMFQYCKKVIIVSKHMIPQLEKLGCPSDKIVFSPASPSQEFFEITPSFLKKNILAVGRFVEKKAPLNTIKAFHTVYKSEPEARLIMAGDGLLFEKCKELVATLDLNEVVKFVGTINTQEHKQLLSESYMFVQHSVTAKSGDSEGTPVAILEASAAGLPVVSTKHAGIPDVIIDSETGFLVPENDIDQMAEKMLELLKDRDKAVRFGKAGKQNILDNFTLEKHIKVISEQITAE